MWLWPRKECIEPPRGRFFWLRGPALKPFITPLELGLHGVGFYPRMEGGRSGLKVRTLPPSRQAYCSAVKPTNHRTLGCTFR